MKKFDSNDFETWITNQLHEMIYDNHSKNTYVIDAEAVEAETSEAFDKLTALELVIYLGEYLTRKEPDYDEIPF